MPLALPEGGGAEGLKIGSESIKSNLGAHIGFEDDGPSGGPMALKHPARATEVAKPNMPDAPTVSEMGRPEKGPAKDENTQCYKRMSVTLIEENMIIAHGPTCSLLRTKVTGVYGDIDSDVQALPSPKVCGMGAKLVLKNIGSDSKKGREKTQIPLLGKREQLPESGFYWALRRRRPVECSFARTPELYEQYWEFLMWKKIDSVVGPVPKDRVGIGDSKYWSNVGWHFKLAQAPPTGEASEGLTGFVWKLGRRS